VFCAGHIYFKIESIINLSIQKAPGPGRVIGEFYQKSEEKNYTNSFFQKTEAERIFPNSFCEVSVILKSKSDR
jgi:hypothetical protein